jgi:putative aldouronate transport system substrate-binding protein
MPQGEKTMRSKVMSRRNFLAYVGATGATLALAACAPAAPGSQVESTTDSTASAEALELILCYGSTAELPDLPVVQAEVNKVLAERLNLTVEQIVFPYAVYNEKMAAKNAAGEAWDLSYSSDVRQPYPQAVANGAFADVTDAIPQYAPTYYADVNPEAWKALKVKGRFYGALNQNWWVGGYGARCRQDLAEKYGLNLSEINQVEDLEPWQEAIVQGETGTVVAPYKPTYHLWRFTPMYGVDKVGQATGYGVVNALEQDLKVYNLWEHPEWDRIMKLTKQWFQKGFFPQEQIPEAEHSAWSQAGKDAWYIHRSSALGPQVPQEGAYFGFDMVSKILDKKMYLIQGAMMQVLAVGRNTTSVEASCKFIDLINTDKPFYNLITKGIEGTHWVWVDKEKEVVAFPEGVDVQTHPFNPGSNFMLGNTFNSYFTDENGPALAAAQKELNDTAPPSSILGFFVEPEPIKNELAALAAVANEYNDLNFGLLDYDEVLPDFIAANQAAGSEKVVAELERQLLEWKASQ